ncbi:MAG: PAS domain S-box protein [Rhodospirillales bacterium]|nr:PAS domain S-box protein [Rhodospirillales bacterium]
MNQDALVNLVIDHVDAAITVYDADGNLIRVNKGAERISGFSYAEMRKPATWRHIIPGDDHQRVMAIIGRRRLEDFPIVNINPWVHKDGTRRQLRWSNVALPDSDGNVAMIVCIGFDITDQHQSEMTLTKAKNEAEQANRAKSEFLANMSHELRTPLNAILGFSEVIRDRHFGDDNARYSEYAANIHDSGEMLLALISDILDMSKLEAGKFKLAEEIVDLGKVLESCRTMVAGRAQDGRITITCQLPASPIRLRGDQRALKQILLNLLSNAIKFTPTGGSVAVSAGRMEGGEVQLSVADTGIGIKPSVLAKVFRPFFQVDHAATRTRSGTGLGLAISKHLAELHGGAIAIDSKPGIGTTVTVTLPAERAVDQDRAG